MPQEQKRYFKASNGKLMCEVSYYHEDTDTTSTSFTREATPLEVVAELGILDVAAEKKRLPKKAAKRKTKVAPKKPKPVKRKKRG